MKKNIHLLFFLLFIVNLFLIIFSHYTLQSMILEIRPTLKTLNQLKSNINESHLWFEEYLIGDTTINIKKDVINKINLKKFDNFLNSLDHTTSDKIIINSFSKIRTNLKIYIEQTKKRLSNKQNNEAGTLIDQNYDYYYNDLNKEIDELISYIEDKEIEEFNINKFYFYIIVVLFLILNLVTIITVNYFLRKDSLNNKRNMQQIKLASLGEMLGNIAHQWRQPLSTISTCASGVKLKKEIEGKVDEEFLDESMNLVIKSSQYLSNTIDDFTNYIKGTDEKENFTLNEMIFKSIDLIKSSLDFHHITIIESLNDIEVLGYKSELIQCIINILNNAKDELKKSNKDRYIFINTIIKKEYVIIKIKDNAGGVQEEIIHKIFEPYFTTKHKSQGTGLGLSMSYNMIQSMKGSLEVSNEEFKYKGESYKGAVFSIKLPK